MTTCSPSPEQKAAASELLQRRSARTTLGAFTCYTFPGFVMEPAHALIATKLDAVVRGEITRLMIFAPPQHGKSELTSVRLPAFWLAKRPDDPVILASYAASLAESKSRQARQIVESPEYARLFPEIRTRSDSRSIAHWHLDGKKGYLLAAGVGGPITGHGARLGIIDDPVENWQEAQSATVRDTCWDWWRTTFRTRIWEGGAIVLIMTRWHEDDLAGRLLRDQPGQWDVLRLPAIAETQEERDAGNTLLGLPLGEDDPLGRQPGEPLCPGRYSLAALQALRRDVGSLGWAGQYQGTPRAPEGNRFKRAWFPLVDVAPYKAERRVRYWDRSASEDGDYTVGILMARIGGVFYIEDMVRGRWSAGQRDVIIKQTAERDALRYNGSVHIWVEQEPGSGGKESAQNAIRMLAGHSVRADKVTGSKEVRAEPLASQAEAGNVRLVRGPWNGAFLDEFTNFPNGAHDDAVDASSGAFNKLSQGRPVGNLFRTLPLRQGKYRNLRLVVCSAEELAGLPVEPPSLLVHIRDPGTEEAYLPTHCLEKCLDSLTLEFADVDPEAGEIERGWEHPLEPWGRKPEELLFTRERQGKRLWSFLSRHRDPRPEIFVFQDSGGTDRRSLSLSLAVCDVLGLPRSETIYRPEAELDWKAGQSDKPGNRHAYSVCKGSRGLVCGEVATGFRPTKGMAWKPLGAIC